MIRYRRALRSGAVVCAAAVVAGWQQAQPGSHPHPSGSSGVEAAAALRVSIVRAPADPAPAAAGV
ncbi:hypothetical protein Prum_071190 [Phytohabitans rumicis]|uniref:Uncharacterized protein n=1 Tax=Phytohabitans rumicis TaxID=1076125 RepID=A0A6V8LHB4_9ACTN|nr:hypothetical protein Prum_071190 [Phytohabitans rumicis]